MSRAMGCDRCKKLSTDSPKTIALDPYVNSSERLSYKEKWELCDKCFDLFTEFMEEK